MRFWPFTKKPYEPDMGDCMAMGGNAVLQTLVLSYANDLKRQAANIHESSRLMRNRVDIMRKRLNRLPPWVFLLYKTLPLMQRFDKKIRASLLKSEDKQWQVALIEEIEAIATRYKADGDCLSECAKDLMVSLAKSRDELSSGAAAAKDPQVAVDLREAFNVARSLTSFIDSKAGNRDNAKTA